MKRLNRGLVAWMGLMLIAAVGEIYPAAPRLVVVVAIDQFRSDYLARFSALYLPARQGDRLGGFRFLMEQGAVYVEAEFSHFATFTCPGHATLLTGAAPSFTGIIANSWFDRASGEVINCVDDLRALPGISRSPDHLMVPTLGDELKLATNGRSKVVALAFKDYSAMVMGGRMADLVLWFNYSDGTWNSNPYFRGALELPSWVRKLNSERIPDQYLGEAWNRLLDDSAYRNTNPSPTGEEPNEFSPFGKHFPHELGTEAGRDFYRRFARSGLANDFVIETAKRAILSEDLGSDDVPDVLAVSLSSNDYVGHDFGPNSPEVLDVTVRTDRALADFLNYLNHKLGPGKVTLVVTSDHGVQSAPQEITRGGGFAGVVRRQQVIDTIEQALDGRLGEADWVAAVTDLDVYLNWPSIDETGHAAEEVEQVAAEAVSKVSGIHSCYGRSQILQGRLPGGNVADRIYSNYHPLRSGDLILVYESNWFMEEDLLTTHGTHHAYNTEVPILLWGAGIQAGRFNRSVDPKDIAPTLARILGIPSPGASTGTPLFEALKEE